jgi:hypothetical protein
MRTRAAAIGLIAVALGGAVVFWKSCGDSQKKPETPAKAEGPKPVDVAAKLREQKPRAPAATAPTAAPESEPAPAPGPEVVFSSPWGGETLDQVGRVRPSEANPEGPMSFAVDGKGRIYVLDQVNGRIVRRGADGKPEVAIPIEAQAAQDLAVAEDGSAAVLDRFASKSVTLYDEKGAKVGEIPLKGEDLEETGLVTGVFVDGNDVYVEKEHGPLIKIGDKSGAPVGDGEQTEIPGRPSRDGLSFIKAGVIDPPMGRVYVSSVERATMQHRFTRELRLEAPVQAIVLLDSDKSGMIYFAAQVERAPGDEVVFLTCLEPLKGVPVGTAVMPVNTLPEETFRDLVVLDGGGVIYSLRSETGVSYQKYDCE